MTYFTALALAVGSIAAIVTLGYIGAYHLRHRKG